MPEGTIKIECGTCANNDDGFCDKLGVIVEDEDKPVKSSCWENKQ